MFLLVTILVSLLSVCDLGDQVSAQTLLATQRTVLAQVRGGERTFESAFRYFVSEQNFSGLHNLFQHEDVGEERKNIYRLMLGGAKGEGSDPREIDLLLHKMLAHGRMHASSVVTSIIGEKLSQSLKTTAEEVVALYKEVMTSWPAEKDFPFSTKKLEHSLRTLSEAYEEFEYLYLNIGKGDSVIGSHLRVEVDGRARDISRTVAKETLLGAFVGPSQDFIGVVEQLMGIVLAVSKAGGNQALFDTISDFRDELTRSHLWPHHYSIPEYHRIDSVIDREIVRHQLAKSSLEGVSSSTIDEAISLVRKYVSSWEQSLPEAIKVIKEAEQKGEATQVIDVVAAQVGISVEAIMLVKRDEQQEKLKKLATQIQRKGYDEQISRTLEDSQSEGGASFLFTGSNQAAKIELAEMIVDYLLGGMVIQIKVDEYHGQQGVHRIIGRPSDYDAPEHYFERKHYGGTLADKIRARPRSVVLFELGKDIEGEPIQEILAKILREGQLTDSFGKIISFHDAVIIVTTAKTEVSKTFAKDFDAVIDFN